MKRIPVSIFIGFFVFLMIALIPTSGFAADTTRTWSGDAPFLGKWTNGANWVGGVAPDGVSDGVIFTGAKTTNDNDFPDNSQFNGITFNGWPAGLGIGGNQINLGGDIADLDSVDHQIDFVGTGITLVNSGHTILTSGTAGNLIIGWPINNNGFLLTIQTSAGTTITTGSDINGTGGLTKSGSGTFVIDTSSYTGATNITGGILKLGNTGAIHDSSSITVSNGATLDMAGNDTLVNIPLNLNGTYSSTVGVLTDSAVVASIYAGVVTLQSDSSIGSDAGNILLTGGLGADGYTLTKVGSDTLELNAASTRTGAIIINAGTLKAGALDTAFGSNPAITVGNGSAATTLDLFGFSNKIGSLAGDTNSTVTNSFPAFGFDSTLTVGGNNTSTTFSGIIKDGDPGLSAVGLIKQGTGTLTLGGAGANTYTAGTVINGGTLRVNKAHAVGTGTLTVADGGTLDLGTTNLAVTGTYAQDEGSTLKLTANTSSDVGRITTGVLADIKAKSTVNVTIDSYMPNGTAITIVNTGGAGIEAVPTTIISSSSFITLSLADLGGNLVLTANRSASNNFATAGATANSNAATVGSVLQNITNPSSDMTTVINTLAALSTSQVASSLESMSPTVDGAVTQSSISMLNQITGAAEMHLENIRTGGGTTGIATGDDYFKGLDIWAQGLGDYAHQDPRGSSNGYNATSWGVSGGADVPLGNDALRMGIGSGYSQTFVRSKDFSGRIDIDSIPESIYCTYENDKYPFYLDAMFTFIYNLYNASRAVTVGTLTQRTASADYDGEQYSGYFEGGYSFFYKNLRLTPLVSFNYMHLHTGSYTETGADALNLSVKAQDYDMALTGFGAKIAYPLEQKWGTLMPDLHAKWLYDWIGDNQATTAGFAGGGTSFGTSGFRAARSAYDLGTKIGLKTKYNISIDLDYDFLLKADYYEHYGSVTVRYSF